MAILQLLLLDNYDSFTYNLCDYLMRQPDVRVQVWRNDQCSIAEIEAAGFDALVLSPGPKRPKDAGILSQVVAHFWDKMPILGICLGHQALGEAAGAKLVQAAQPMHGKTSRIRHSGQGIFADLPNPMSVMRYHSLLLESVPEAEFIVTASTDKGECMAIEHRCYPLHGVQFHPESILTPDGLQWIANWCQFVKKYVKKIV